MIVRAVSLADAAAMTGWQNAVVRIGGTIVQDEARRETEETRDHLTGPWVLCCPVAVAAGGAAGFQALWRHPDSPEDRGDIGTYVRAGLHRSGLGAALFAATADRARAYGLWSINPTIRADNAAGPGCYARCCLVDDDHAADCALKDGRVMGRVSGRFAGTVNPAATR